MARRAALMLVILQAAAWPAAASAEDDPACAKYDEPLAYNACLASHGPKANDVGKAASPGEPARSAPAEVERAPRSPSSRPVAGWPSASRRGGRVHMEFHVK
jgi:hypothetical protein